MEKIIGLSSDSIVSYAAKGERPEADMDEIDLVLWFTVRDIYREFRSGSLDKETGAQRKKAALDAFDAAWEKKCRDRDLVFRSAELWKAIEETATAYRKQPSMETADRMMNVIYGLLEVDDG